MTVSGILILATFASLSLSFTADSIISLFSKLERSQHTAVVHALQLGSLVVWSRLLQHILIGVEQAYQNYGLINILNTIQYFSLSLGLIGVALRGGRTVELMECQVLISILILLGHIWVVRSLVKSAYLRPIWKTEKVFAIAKYSFTVWLLTLGTALFSRGDRLIVGYYLGSENLGIYAGITEITSAINSLSALPVQPLVPILSSYSKNHNISRVELIQKVKQSIQINAFFALGSAAFLFIMSPLIMRLMFEEIGEIPKGSRYRISMTVALWKKETLLKILKAGETAWDIEKRGGVERANEIDDRFYALPIKTFSNPPLVDIHLISKGQIMWRGLKMLKDEHLLNYLETRPNASFWKNIYFNCYDLIFNLYYRAVWFFKKLRSSK